MTAKTESEKVNSLVSTMENLQLTPPGRTLGQEVPHHTRLKIWYAACQLIFFFPTLPHPFSGLKMSPPIPPVILIAGACCG